MNDIRITSIFDPANCPWLDAFEVKADHDGITVNYISNSSAPSGAQIQLGWNVENSREDNTWVKSSSLSGGSSISYEFPSSKEAKKEMNNVWWVEISSGSTTYYRSIYFANAIKIFKGNYGSNPTDEELDELFPERTHREYMNRKDTAVCYSGGGTRAALLAMGQMRYLSPYSGQIGYASSVSGGSWAASIYTYATQGNLDKLLGPVETNPSNYQSGARIPNLASGMRTGVFGGVLLLNLVRSFPLLLQGIKDKLNGSEIENDLKQVSGPLDDLLNSIEEKTGWNWKVAPDQFWIESVGAAYFLPNFLYTPKCLPSSKYRGEFFTLDAASEASMKLEPGSFHKLAYDSTILKVRTNAKSEYPPYLVINSVMLRPADDPKSTGPYLGYEYTPLYQGPAHNGLWNDGVGAIAPYVGKGSFPMFSYGAQAGSSAGSVIFPGSYMNTVYESSAGTPSLAVASGTSSSAFAGATQMEGGKLTVLGIAAVVDIVIAYLKGKSKKEVKSLLTESTNIAFSDTLTAGQNGESQSGLGQVNDFVADYGEAIWNILAFIVQQKTKWPDLFNPLTPKANYFAPLKEGKKPAPNTLFDFGDAGLADNFGILAMLRRKVSKIVVFVNTSTPFDPDAKVVNGKTDPNHIDSSMAAIFGCASGWDNVGGIRLGGLQAFSQEDFEDILGQLRSHCQKMPDGTIKTNSTLYARKKMTVLENKDRQVPGGWEADVMWVYNCMPQPWYDKLPAELKATADSNSFPFNNTGKVTLVGASRDTINTMANLAYWNLSQISGEVKSLLGLS